MTKSNVKNSIIIRDLNEGAALDFCYDSGLICWTDHGLELIQCASYNGTHATNRVSFLNIIFFNRSQCLKFSSLRVSVN